MIAADFAQDYHNQQIAVQTNQTRPPSGYSVTSSVSERRSCIDGWVGAFGTSASAHSPSNPKNLGVADRYRDEQVNVFDSAISGILRPRSFATVTPSGRSDLEQGFVVGLRTTSSRPVHRTHGNVVNRPYM